MSTELLRDRVRFEESHEEERYWHVLHRGTTHDVHLIDCNAGRDWLRGLTSQRQTAIGPTSPQQELQQQLENVFQSFSAELGGGIQLDELAAVVNELATVKSRERSLRAELRSLQLQMATLAKSVESVVADGAEPEVALEAIRENVGTHVESIRASALAAFGEPADIIVTEAPDSELPISVNIDLGSANKELVDQARESGARYKFYSDITQNIPAEVLDYVGFAFLFPQ